MLRKLFKLLMFLIGVFLAAYGILLILLPAVGLRTQAGIVEVRRPLTVLQDRIPEYNIHFITYTFADNAGAVIAGYAVQQSGAQYAHTIGEVIYVRYIEKYPLLSAPGSDAGLSVKNGLITAAGLLLFRLSLLRRKKRRSQSETDGSRRPMYSSSRKTQYCHACGKKLPLTAKFCTGCGIANPFLAEMPAGPDLANMPETASAEQAPEPELQAVNLSDTDSCVKEGQPAQLGQEGKVASPLTVEMPAVVKESVSVPARKRKESARRLERAAAAAVPGGKKKRHRKLAVIASLLLAAGIAAGIVYREELQFAAEKLYYQNKWRFAQGKAENEKLIRDMLSNTAEALERGDAAAASAFVFPPNAEKLKALFTGQPEGMKALAVALRSAKDIRLGDSYTNSYGFTARAAEVTAVYDGGGFTVQLLQVGDSWYINTL
jgi:hypothetical protein